MAPFARLPLPVSHEWLDTFRIHTQRRLRASLMGSHTARRHGQSREFLEMAEYTPGDDVRTVDWIASLRSRRYPGDPRLIVRKFEAEQHYRFLISIDTRATMRYPAVLPKLQLAMWLAEAFAWMALRDDHHVALHRLFGPSASSLVEMRGKRAAGRLGPALDLLGAWEDNSPLTPEPNLAVVDQFLRPAAIWLILTDLYWADPSAPTRLDPAALTLAHRIHAAQAGWRWIMLVDLDSWPHEIAQMGLGAMTIEGPGQIAAPPEIEMGEREVRTIAETIDTYKRAFFDEARLPHGSLESWLYPAAKQVNALKFFKENLQHSNLLSRLLSEGS